MAFLACGCNSKHLIIKLAKGTKGMVLQEQKRGDANPFFLFLLEYFLISKKSLCADFNQVGDGKDALYSYISSVLVFLR